MTFRVEYLEEACRLTDVLLDGFFDPEEGGFYPCPPSGARYYLCRDGACRNPADSLEALAAQMAAPHNVPPAQEN